MTLHTPVIDSAKIILEFLLDVLYFPLWWYSRGFFKVLVWAKNFLVHRQRALALGIWAKNIFTPMYGQHDLTGKLISFVTRLLQVFFRSVFMLFWLACSAAVIAAWLALPILVVYQLLFQLTRG